MSMLTKSCDAGSSRRSRLGITREGVSSARRPFWAIAAAILLMLSELGTAQVPRTEAPLVCASTPTLADLTTVVGHGVAKAAPLWNGRGAPADYVPGPESKEQLRASSLLVIYGVEPFHHWEETLARAFPAQRVLVLCEPGGAGDLAKCGELALSPQWAFGAARVVAARLKMLFPERGGDLDVNLARFGKQLAKEALGERFFSADEPRIRFEQYSSELCRQVAQEGAGPLELGGWAGRLRGFQGLPLSDDRSTLGPFCAAFGIAQASERPQPRETEWGHAVHVEWVEAQGESGGGVRTSGHVQVQAGDIAAPISDQVMTAAWTGGYIARVDAVVSAVEGPLAAAWVRLHLPVDGAGRRSSSMLMECDGRHVRELLAIVADKRRSAYWSNARYALAYIGDDRGFEAIIPGVEGLLKAGGDELNDAVLLRLVLEMPMQLGIMAYRSEKALRYIEAGCEPAFWSARISAKRPAQSGGVTRELLAEDMAARCISAVPMSGRVGPEWIEAMLKRMPKKFWESEWPSIIDADAYIWWQETYGMNQFRLEYFGPMSARRFSDYWVSDRAKKLRARVLPPGVKLSDEPIAD